MKGTGPCVNCGSVLGYVSRGAQIICIACDWEYGKMVPEPEAPLCSICRRHHGHEITHARE